MIYIGFSLRVDGILSLLFIRVRDESKATGATSLTVTHHNRLHHDQSTVSICKPPARKRTSRTWPYCPNA
ncbi:hypothetical protein AG1IA_00877 [Rhizoctonia solani AG-1 IA]|uniref:Uncharacterized protein n=1 Tax=Thanatephorus cucumeris (strain AG1-IA) TaxID=983506 RepID=L8X8W4_THACA|nr:hypothetical protein AG1IA_00877 [Rhizoctonia solani AG-1 IA]